jgi:hypothetical protein
VDLARNAWKLRAVVVDATGVAAGLASFLANQLGRGLQNVIVATFFFNRKTKPDLGWTFRGLISTALTARPDREGDRLAGSDSAGQRLVVTAPDTGVSV